MTDPTERDLSVARQVNGDVDMIAGALAAARAEMRARCASDLEARASRFAEAGDIIFSGHLVAHELRTHAAKIRSGE